MAQIPRWYGFTYHHWTYTIPELERAFNRIADSADWRAPIKARVDDVADLPVILAAIAYFTATEGEVEIDADENGDFRTVRSVGYRAGPAGP